MNTQQTQLSIREKIGYGLGDTASNLIFQTVLMFMPFFYTDIFGISAAAMGSLFLAVRLIDAISDPLMGALADRTQSRWGKFRPYLLCLAIPYGLVAVSAFTTPDFSNSGKLLYAYVSYTLLMLIYTAINIPYCSLGGVLTASSRERVSINSYRFFLSTAGGLIVAATTLPLVAWLGGGDDQAGYQRAMIIFSILAAVLFFICFFCTQERVVEIRKTQNSFWNDLKLLWQNDQWRIVSAINFILLVAIVMRGASAIYYLTWYADRSDLISAFLSLGMAASMVGASLASSLTRRLPMVTAYLYIQAAIVVASIALYFVHEHQIILIFMLFGLIQFFVQMSSPILWTMMADTVDYGEWKSGRRITGLAFSGSLFFLKLGMAVGGALIGWLLAGFDYQGEAEAQSPQTIGGIVLIFTLLPALGHFLLMLIIPKYQLDQKRCDEIRLQLSSS